MGHYASNIGLGTLRGVVLTISLNRRRNRRTPRLGSNRRWFEDDIITGHVILEDESVVVAGKFTSAALFEEIGLGSVGINGDTDAFLGMINSSGNWTSAFNFGSLGDDGIDSIALHPSGDLVVVGHFCLGTAGENCEMNLSTFNLNKTETGGEGDAFVGRFTITNDSFEPIWVRAIGNAGDLSGFDIEISPNGGVTAAVLHKANLDIEGQILPGSDGTNIAIFHYDENGVIQWSNGIISPDGIEILVGCVIQLMVSFTLQELS